MNKFSVLMSVYKHEKPEFLNRSLQSIWIEQTIQPSEIVLVKDGPLSDGLNSEINKWQTIIENKLKVVTIDKNVGLGNALNIGLKHCSYELVGRMDSDDISLPNRFQEQLKVFSNPNIDVCSSSISEFEGSEENLTSYRINPQFDQDIKRYARTKSPVNHIPVMFKKSCVENVGGYMHMPFFEDYFLWVRLILNDYVFYNIPMVLANIRGGNDQLSRRRGLKYAKCELNFLFKIYKIQFLKWHEFILNSILRFIVRLTPLFLVKLIYKIHRRYF